jgi:NAD(P)-dependent dehydrogenase (short-subunit alcohol dehydrogenase family)
MRTREKGLAMTTGQLKPVEEQVVALMGASSGIGRETALRFAKRGAKVVVAARSEAGLDSLVEEIRRDGGQATAVVADTSQFDQVKAVADRAVEEYGSSTHGCTSPQWGYSPPSSRPPPRSSSGS